MNVRCAQDDCHRTGVLIPSSENLMLQSRDTLSRLCAGVLGAMALVASCPLTAAGEDSLRDSAANIDQVLPETELDEATEESEAAPREGGLFKRLGRQQVTPEEQAQAEHLRKLAAKYGTDPTAIVGRIQSSSAYYDLHQGGHAVDATARIDLPLQRNFLLRVDVPFLKWSEPNRLRTSVSRGLSDMAVTAAWRVYNTPEYAVAFGVISTCPTAAETALGLGKYTVGPTIATVRFV